MSLFTTRKLNITQAVRVSQLAGYSLDTVGRSGDCWSFSFENSALMTYKDVLFEPSTGLIYMGSTYDSQEAQREADQTHTPLFDAPILQSYDFDRTGGIPFEHEYFLIFRNKFGTCRDLIFDLASVCPCVAVGEDYSARLDRKGIFYDLDNFYQNEIKETLSDIASDLLDVRKIMLYEASPNVTRHIVHQPYLYDPDKDFRPWLGKAVSE